MQISIRSDSTVVILTGAGISAESGLKTFRESGGLWEEYNVYDVATPEAFAANPELVWEFYNKRRQQIINAKPNDAHRAITDFQSRFPGTFVITQNVDDLHEKAGNMNIIHMHGELNSIKCTSCSYSRKDLSPVSGIPVCPECSSPLRPDIVWFGEIPYHMQDILRLLSTASLFIAVGTSGTVYPAAQFIEIASAAGAETVYINKEYVKCHSSQFIQGSASEKLPELLSSIGAYNV